MPLWLTGNFAELCANITPGTWEQCFVKKDPGTWERGQCNVPDLKCSQGILVWWPCTVAKIKKALYTPVA